MLGGKDKAIELAALLAGKPGMTPEEKLRAYLNHIESRRHLLVSADDRYGSCDLCGKELADSELDEMAWADRCRACACLPG